MWQSFDKGNLDLCLKEPYQFFLVRPKGLHPARDVKCCPTVVQLIENQIYTADNELEPIVFSHKDDQFHPSSDPFECNLEWCELPE